MLHGSTLDPALIEAAKAKQYDLMRAYLEKGATCSAKENGSTLIHMAIRQRDDKMLDLLLDYNIDLSVKDRDGLTPMGLAGELRYWDYVAKIASKHKEDRHGFYEYGNALLVASADNNLEMVRVLLAAGAKAETWHHNPSKDTSLHDAVRLRNLTMLKVLLRHAASNISYKNAAGRSAIEYAADLGYWDCVLLFALSCKSSSSGFEFYRVLTAVMHQELFQHAEALLKAGAYPDHQDQNAGNDTPLHIAVRKNNPRMVALLMKYKADPNITNAEKMTPVLLANKLKRWECADAFVHPERYLNNSEADKQKKLFYLFAAHSNKNNIISRVPYDVFKIILNKAFGNAYSTVPKFNEVRSRYENFREERHFLGSVSMFIQAYQSLGALRQWTVGQSNNSRDFVEALHDIITSHNVIPAQVAEAKMLIRDFVNSKANTKSRALDLLQYYKLMPEVECQPKLKS